LNHEEKIQIKNALRHARYWLIIPVFIILILSHLIRALRWKLLIGSLGFRTKTENAFFAVMIGYLTNMAVPRLGEILKCTVLAKYEKVPADKLIGTIILERVIDTLTLLLIFLVNAFFHSPHEPAKKKISGFLIAAIFIAAVALGLALWMLIKKKTINDVAGLFRQVGKSVWQGVSAIQHLKKRGLFLLYTVALWSCYFFSTYIGFYAFRETQQYGIAETFALLAAGSIGVIVTPGGIGAYALLVKKTMELYGLEAGIALAFGWILWLVQTFVILLGGIFSFAAIPYFNKKRNIEAG
jgi:uncharacterized protein (TIRG00374 family)